MAEILLFATHPVGQSGVFMFGTEETGVGDETILILKIKNVTQKKSR